MTSVTERFARLRSTLQAVSDGLRIQAERLRNLADLVDDGLRLLPHQDAPGSVAGPEPDPSPGPTTSKRSCAKQGPNPGASAAAPRKRGVPFNPFNNRGCSELGPDEFTLRQAHGYSGIADATLKQLALDGEIPYRVEGDGKRRRMVVTRADLDALKARWPEMKLARRRARTVEADAAARKTVEALLARDEITLTQAAEVLGCAYTTAQNMTRDGRMPSRKAGHVIAVKQADVARLKADGWAKPRRGRPKGKVAQREPCEVLPRGRCAYADCARGWGFTAEQVRQIVKDGWLRGDQDGVVTDDIPEFAGPDGMLHVIRRRIKRDEPITPVVNQHVAGFRGDEGNENEVLEAL